jgi:hypothetical protein
LLTADGSQLEAHSLLLEFSLTTPKEKFETRKLPMMPIRDVVIFPHMMTPFVVGRESSVRALEEALASDKKIFLATQHDASIDEPKANEIYQIGTVVNIVQSLKLPDGNIKVLVEGIERAKVLQITDTEGYMQAAGWSNYHALQVDFRQKPWHGLQFDANYAWSHTLGTVTANQWQGVINQFTIRDLRQSYGPTLFDIRHAVHISGTYDLPIGKGKEFLNYSGPIDRILGGWTAGTIFTFHTGTPFLLRGAFRPFNDYGDGGVVLNGITMSQLQSSVGVYHVGATFVDIINPSILKTLNTANAVIQSSTTPGVIGFHPWLYGPSFTNFDIAVTKNTALTERFRLKFQSEFLNAFNHPNFGLSAGTVAPSIRSSSFGRAGTISAARQIELRLSLEF